MCRTRRHTAPCAARGRLKLYVYHNDICVNSEVNFEILSCDDTSICSPGSGVWSTNPARCRIRLGQGVREARGGVPRQATDWRTQSGLQDEGTSVSMKPFYRPLLSGTVHLNVLPTRVASVRNVVSHAFWIGREEERVSRNRRGVSRRVVFERLTSFPDRQGCDGTVRYFCSGGLRVQFRYPIMAMPNTTRNAFPMSSIGNLQSVHHPLSFCSIPQHVVYNQVDPSLRNSYARPAYMDDKAWKKASVVLPFADRFVKSHCRCRYAVRHCFVNVLAVLEAFFSQVVGSSSA